MSVIIPGIVIETIAPGTASAPAVIPAGRHVVVLSSAVAGAPSSALQFDAAFEVGSEVEFYNIDASQGTVLVFDENGRDVTPGLSVSTGLGTRYRKFASGSFPTWGRVS